MIQRFQVILLVLFSPDFVESFLRLSPLFLFAFQSSKYHRHGYHGILLESVDDVGSFVAVYPSQRALMDRRGATAQAVIEFELLKLLLRHSAHLLVNALEHSYRRGIGFYNTVELKPFVFATVDEFLKLRFPKNKN